MSISPRWLLALSGPLAAALMLLLPSPVPASEPVMVYQPPLRGAPLSLVGAGARGVTTAAGLTLCVLAPDHTGLTVSAQPTLHWYLSDLPDTPLRFTLVEVTSERVVAAVPLQPRRAGVQSTALGTLGVRLELGREYAWTVALLDRAAPVMVSGQLRYVAPHLLLNRQLRATDDAAAAYAGQGIWYDAIAALSQQIAARPATQTLHRQRAALLEQVKLPKAAAYDRQLAAAS